MAALTLLGMRLRQHVDQQGFAAGEAEPLLAGDIKRPISRRC